MPYLIGTDEAGYGPNLGPLVVSATLWHVDEKRFHADLYEELINVISPVPLRKNDAGRIAIADSKLLYKSHGSLAGLERGVLTALRVTRQIETNTLPWENFWHAIAPDCCDQRESLPWHLDFGANIPRDLYAADLEPLAERIAAGLQQRNVRLCAVRSTAVFPGRFNELIDLHGNKASALSQVTLELVHQMLQAADDEPVLILCDKHGGRNKYGPLLQERFPDSLVEVYSESRQQSVYRWGAANRRTEIRFTAKGEQFLPSALASMASKYLRELAMQAFNAFWCRHFPQLKPTAGYPQDAKRFKAEIHAKQTELEIDDHVLWRKR